MDAEFLATLTDAERSALMRQGRRRTLPRGAMLITEGTRSGDVFVVLAGHLKVFSTTDRGAEIVLAVRGPGALLGELAAIDDEPRAASVCAIEPVEVLAVPAAAFSQFLRDNPTVMLTLMRTLTGRLRDADRKRVEFGAYDAVSRVALRLVELADRFGRPVADGVVITLPFTQDELAGWVGASREAVVKALRTLRQLGYVRTQRRTVVVCDVPALRRRAGLADH
jgi:CRP/FNR family transcriptional regulator, cyclic AMP receptor protein